MPMSRFVKLTAAAVMAASLAACAQSVAQPNFDPPPAKRVDAKTALETGRR
jgi:hypothetical protein